MVNRTTSRPVMKPGCLQLWKTQGFFHFGKLRETGKFEIYSGNFWKSDGMFRRRSLKPTTSRHVSVWLQWYLWTAGSGLLDFCGHNNFRWWNCGRTSTLTFITQRRLTLQLTVRLVTVELLVFMLLETPRGAGVPPFPPLLLPCPFTSSSFALYYLFPFSFSHPLYLFSSIVHPIFFYRNSPTPFPGVRS